MKIISLSLIFSTILAFSKAKVGNISDFNNYPGIVDLINANTKNYSSNFKKTFTDGPIYSGDGTAYGDAKSGGNCLFPKKEYYDTMMYAALNNDQYNIDMGCGLCALVVSTSNPYKAIRVRIIDQCPECEHGSLDFSDIAFKALSNKTPDRIKITWALIPCDIDVNEYHAFVKPGSDIKFQFKSGTTAHWGEVQVFNTRYPVTNVAVQLDGQFEELSRRRYNYWGRLNNRGFGNGPYTFRVTLADSTVIEAKNVEMVVPPDDEGEDFSSGTQTIIKAGSTSSNTSGNTSNNNSSNNNNKKTSKTKASSKSTIKKTTTKKNSNATSSANNECPASILRQGYKCCEESNCDIYYKDGDGDWGVSSSIEWCGTRYSCKNNSKAVASGDDSCSSKFKTMGYECCDGCNVRLTDADGKWGVEKNQWCGIRNDC